MQRFRFRLERIFRWQERVCALKEEDVRLGLQAVSKTDGQIAQIKAFGAAVDQDLRLRPALTGADLMALGQFRARVAKDESRLEVLRAGQLQAVDRQRAELIAERRRFRLLEKLREKALAEYAASAERETEVLAMECDSARRISQRGRASFD